MSANHTSTYTVRVIKYTDSLYVRGISENGVTLVPQRNMASEYGEEDLKYLKEVVALMIKLGLKKDSIFIVEESEMVVKNKEEMTVDAFVTPELEKEGFVIQDVWGLRD